MHRRRICRLFLVCLLVVFLTGGTATPCLTNNKGGFPWRDQILEDAPAALKVGVNTREEAPLKFGEPDLALNAQKMIRLRMGDWCGARRRPTRLKYWAWERSQNHCTEEAQSFTLRKGEKLLSPLADNSIS